MAVTKGHGLDAVRAALAVGLTDIGENYSAELLAKAASLAGSPEAGSPEAGSPEAGSPEAGTPRWHYLGAVQRNKVGRLAPVVSCWQSVSRPQEAVAIGRHPGAREVFVEIDVSGEPTRGGCAPGEAATVVEAARAAGCVVRGLMTVAPLSSEAGSEATASHAFATVAGLAETLGLGELSMGMSHDLEQAVAAGSTMVRIGTALFGERPAR